MPTPLDFVIGALAVWRLSSLLHRERGPFDIFHRLRELIGVKHGDGMLGDVFPDTYLGQLFACVWCLSVNVAIVWTVIYAIWPTGCRWASLPLALSALGLLVEKNVR
jgi:hypothetical protein